MWIFKKKGASLKVVIYADAPRIEALAFEFTPQRKNHEVFRKGGVKILKRLYADLPPGADPLRVARRLHELLYEIIKGFERVPDEIIVSPGPGMAEYSIEERQLTGIFKDLKTKKEFLRHLREGFSNLLKSERSKEKFLTAYPVGLAVNGYTIELEESQPDADCVKYHLSDELKEIKSVSVFSLSLRFPPNLAEELEHIKASFGGLPVKFLPLTLAQKYVLTRVLEIKNALWLDMEESGSTLALLRCGDLVKLKTFARQAPDLKEFYTSGPIPGSVFLLGKGAADTETRNSLKTSGWFRNFSFTDSPDLKVVNAEAFFEGNTLGGFLKGPEDINLAMLMIYSAKNEETAE